MQVHYQIDQLPVFRNAVLTIGTFDGVHSGHRQIIKELKDCANLIGGETIIITFHPHPRSILAAGTRKVRLINTLPEKIELLANLGIDHLVVVAFTEAFSNQSAEEYIRDFLVAKFHPHTIIIGYDHRFGKERKGDFSLLAANAGRFHYVLKEIPKHVLDEIAISSTIIREALTTGNIETAGKLLGYDFFFAGKVVDGDKIGRQLGYPTANLAITDEEKIVPGDGIFAVDAAMEHQVDAGTVSGATVFNFPYKGMMSIGIRPTVGGKKKVIEVNLFDFNQDIYGLKLRVSVRKYLRAEIKFDSLADLVKQMDEDKRNSLSLL